MNDVLSAMTEARGILEGIRTTLQEQHRPRNHDWSDVVRELNARNGPPPLPFLARHIQPAHDGQHRTSPARKEEELCHRDPVRRLHSTKMELQRSADRLAELAGIISPHLPRLPSSFPFPSDMLHLAPQFTNAGTSLDLAIVASAVGYEPWIEHALRDVIRAAAALKIKLGALSTSQDKAVAAPASQAITPTRTNSVKLDFPANQPAPTGQGRTCKLLPIWGRMKLPGRDTGELWVELDGICYKLTPKCLSMLRLLVDAKGASVPETTIKEKAGDMEPASRIWGRLPDPIKDHVRRPRFRGDGYALIG